MAATQTARAHDDAIFCVAWLDNERLVTGSVDESLRVWRAVDGRAPVAVRTHAGAHLLGVTALSAENGGHRAWRARRAAGDGGPLQRRPAAEPAPFPAPRLPSRPTHTSGFCSAGFGEISVWSAEDEAGVPASRVATLAVGHLEAISLVWSPAAGLLAGGSHAGGVNFWAVSDAPAGGGAALAAAGSVATRAGALVHAVAFSPDGALVAAGHADGTVTVIDVEARAVVQTLEAHALPVRAVAFSADARELHTGSEDARVGTLRLDGGGGGGGGGGARARSLRSGHIGFVTSVAASQSPERALIASASADKTVKLWAPGGDGDAEAEATLMLHVDKVAAVAFSADGRRLASVSDAGTLAVTTLAALT